MTPTDRDENQDVSLPQNGLDALPEGVFVDGVGSKTKIQNPVFEKSYVNIGDVWHIHGASDAKNIPEDIVLRQNFEGKFVINSDLPTNQKSIISFKYTVVKYTLMVIFGVLIIAGITLAVFALLMPSTKQQNDSDYKYDESVLDNSTLRIITRREWSALPSKETPRNLAVNPPKMVIIGHTAGPHCNVTARCSVLVRNIQAYHLSIYGDIGYNFLIGGDGLAYAGLGWGVEGSHTKYYNNRSIGISFIGNFMTVAPPKRQLHAGIALIEYGVKHGKIDPDYVLYGHKQLIATESPGEELMLEIEKWPHWEPRN